MNNDLIKKDYFKKIELLQSHNKHYYDKAKPIISDEEFDLLKRDIIDLENKYNFLSNKQSPTRSVGFKPSKNFKKVKHKVAMLSLGNAFNEEDVRNFEKKIINFLSLKNLDKIEYSAEPKIDGISASLIYVDGKFIRGLSRGDGNEGGGYNSKFKNNSRHTNYNKGKKFSKRNRYTW